MSGSSVFDLYPNDKRNLQATPTREDLTSLLLLKYPFARVVPPFSPIYQATLQPSLLEPEDAKLLSLYIDNVIKDAKLVV